MRFPGWIAATASLASLLLFACGGPSGAKSKNKFRSAYSCQETDIPCRAEQADPDQAGRAAKLLERARKKRKSGESFPAIADWLRDQSGTKQVFQGLHWISFRLEKTRPYFLFDPKRLAEIEEAQSSGSSSSATRKSGLRPETRRQSQGAQGERTPPDIEAIVGTDRNSDGRRDVDKKALVVSPFDSEDSFSRTRSSVQAALHNLPEYKGSITVKPNQKATLDAFDDWRDFDVVVVATHGSAKFETKGGKIRQVSMLATGIEVKPPPAAESSCDLWSQFQSKHNLQGVSGLSCGVTPSGKTRLVLTPDYFEMETKAPYEDTLIVLAGCSTGAIKTKQGRSSILAEKLVGTGSAMYGWDGTIAGSVDASAMNRLFGYLAKGLDHRGAYRKACADGPCSWECPKGPDLCKVRRTATLRHFDKEPGPPVRTTRIREVITIHPPGGGPRIYEGSELYKGIPNHRPDDGMNESFQFEVRLHGVEKHQLPSLVSSVMGGERREEIPYKYTYWIGKNEQKAEKEDQAVPVSGETTEKVDPYTYEAIPLFTDAGYDLKKGDSILLQYGMNLRGESEGDRNHSYTPKFNHTFDGCTFDVSISGDVSGSFSGYWVDLRKDESLQLGLGDPQNPDVLKADLGLGMYDFEKASLLFDDKTFRWDTELGRKGLSPPQKNWNFIDNGKHVEGQFKATLALNGEYDPKNPSENTIVQVTADFVGDVRFTDDRAICVW